MLVTILGGLCFANGVKTIGEYGLKKFMDKTHRQEETKKKKEKKEKKKGESKEMRKLKDEKVDAFETWMRSFCDANGYNFSKASQTRFFINGIRVDIKYKLIDSDSVKLYLITDDDLCDEIESYMEKDPCMEIINELIA